MPDKKDIDKGELIVSALKTMIFQKGYDKTSIEDITREANISKGSFYTYFKNKDDVLNVILTRKHEIYKKKIEKILTLDASLEETLEEILRMRLSFDDESIEQEMTIINALRNFDALAESSLEIFKEMEHTSDLMVQNLLIKYCDEINIKTKDLKKVSKIINYIIDEFRVKNLFINKDSTRMFFESIDELKNNVDKSKIDDFIEFLKGIILKILK